MAHRVLRYVVAPIIIAFFIGCNVWVNFCTGQEVLPTMESEKDVAVLNEELKLMRQRIVPIGIISIWHGDVDDIPQGWEECDGDNGTPDLTGSLIPGTTAFIMKL